MFWIVLLVVLGLLFLLAEILLLPGLSVGALLALICYGSATWMAFAWYGTTAGGVTVAAILAASGVMTVWALRAKTWQRFSLNHKIESAGNTDPQNDDVKRGDRGVAVSRLSPMGTVEIAGRRYEAKSAEAYIDQRSEVEVVGFENANVIVRRVTNENA